ncbi:molybdopterin-dependent oxidoreductase [Thermodesulfobacteriota bacterium]
MAAEPSASKLNEEKRVETKRSACFVCNRGCGLLVDVDRETGKIVRVRGDKDNPFSKGYVCGDRVQHLVKWINHPDQLKVPLKRVGERGENKWERISWNQALDEIAAKLETLKKQHGPECLATIEGTWRSDLYWARSRFLGLFGNPQNTFRPGTICFGNAVMLGFALLGNPIDSRGEGAKCLVTWGKNTPESYPVTWLQNIQAKKNAPPGQRPIHIVVDPRLTETARNADLWLQLRPGTDGALLMGWLNVIINEGLYDREFVENWTNACFLVPSEGSPILRESDISTNGSNERYLVWDTTSQSPVIWDPEQWEYDVSRVKPALEGSFQVSTASGKTLVCKTAWELLKERAAPYTPAQTEKITWVPAEKIEAAARLYATTKPASIPWAVSKDQIGRNSSRAIHIQHILSAVTGNIEVPGGEQIQAVPTFDGKKAIGETELSMPEACSPETKEKQLGADQYRIGTWPARDIVNRYYEKVWGSPRPLIEGIGPIDLLWKAILEAEPYPVKAVISWAGSPMTWAPNTRRVHRALKSPNLELHVAMDHFMTATCQLADYVLPASSKIFERAFCTTHYDLAPFIRVWEQAIEPLGERRSEYDLFRGLARRLGFGEHFPWETLEEIAEHRLEPLGMTFEEAVEKRFIFKPPEVKGYAKINPETGKPRGFATPTGRFEIYSTVFEMLGYDGLPFYEEPPESPIRTPEIAEDYPLVLTTGGRVRPFFHSDFRQYGAGFREQHPDPMMEIHPDAAKRYGISDGEWTWAETPRGRCKQKARVTAAIHPKVVNVQSHWWFPEQPGEEPWLHGIWESNANMLTLDTEDSRDPLIGNWCNRGLLCRIYPCEPKDFREKPS